MTDDGRFTWDDMDDLVDRGFAGLDPDEAFGAVASALDKPVLGDGSPVPEGSFDRGSAEAYLTAAYVFGTAEESARRAEALADEALAEDREAVDSAVSAVTGVPREVLAEARRLRSAGLPGPLASVYSDYLERS